MNAAAELGGNPVSKHQIQAEYGDEQADTGRDDCRTCLARSNSQARARTGKFSFFPVQLTPSRIGDLTRLIHTLATGICVTIHTNSSTALGFSALYPHTPYHAVILSEDPTSPETTSAQKPNEIE